MKQIYQKYQFGNCDMAPAPKIQYSTLERNKQDFVLKDIIPNSELKPCKMPYIFLLYDFDIFWANAS